MTYTAAYMVEEIGLDKLQLGSAVPGVCAYTVARIDRRSAT